MPERLLDQIQADPEFTRLSSKGKREFLREVLGRDPDFRSLSQQGQAEFSNEIFRRYPDATKATAPPIATPAKATKPGPNPLDSTMGFVDYASAPNVAEQIAPKAKPATKPTTTTLPAKPQGDAMVRSSLKEQQAAQAREKKRKPAQRIYAPLAAADRPGLNAAAENEPSVIAKAAGAVGNVLSTPSGILKAIAQPLEVQLADALTKGGFGYEGRSPADIKEQKRVAALPLPQRVGVVKGQDWRTLGRTPETQMQRSNRDRQGNTAEQVFGGVGQFLGDLVSDPLTLAAGGGNALERALVARFPQLAKAAQIANKAAGGAMAGQQLATGIPALESGVQSGDPRELLQGILSTIMGGLAGAHVTGAGEKLATGIENRRTAKTTSQRMEKIGRVKVGETLPGTLTPPSVLLQNSLKNEIASNVVAENAITPPPIEKTASEVSKAPVSPKQEAGNPEGSVTSPYVDRHLDLLSAISEREYVIRGLDHEPLRYVDIYGKPDKRGLNPVVFFKTEENAQNAMKRNSSRMKALSQPVATETVTLPDATAEPATKHKFSSSQVNLPPDISQEVKTVSSKLIPESDLADDGREAQPHITVKYGLHTDDPAKLQQVLANEPPIKVKLGKTSIFPASESGSADVVKVDVDSPDLHRLNKLIADTVDHTDTHPEYKPHVTLAYVKPGEGAKYVGDASLAGKEITLNSLTFSDRNGNITEIPLGGVSLESALTPAENVPAPPVDAQTSEQVISSTKPKPAPSPAVSDMSQMRMRDVAAFAAEQGIALEDKANWKETHGDVINRAMGEYDNILHSLRQYDPTKNPQATPEERYVAAYRQREIKGELDKAVTAKNQAKIDALLEESKRLSNLLYRTGSEAGRALQFQQVIIGDKLDVNSVLNRAEAMTDGKLSNPARRSLIGLASEAEKAKAAADAALQAKAEQAKKQVRVRTNKSAQETPTPEGIKKKLISKLSSEEQAKLTEVSTRLNQKLTKASSALPGAQFIEALPELTEIGVLYAKAVGRSFSEWAAAMRGHVDSLDEGQMQVVWTHTKEAMRKESNGQPAQLQPQTFADSIRQKLGSEKAVSFFDAIDDEGNHTILNKLMRGEQLTSDEKMTVVKAWQANAPQRGKGSGQLAAVQALSEIVKEGRTYTPPKPKTLTAQALQERAQKTLANLGQPATPRAKPTVPEALMAEWEYAQGARDLNTFARRIQAQMGGKMEQGQIDALFAEAVKRYTADYKSLDDIKNKMAQEIRNERYRLKTPLGKASYWTGEGLQAVTSLKATLDLSGWLRQGGIMAISRPGVGAEGFRKMIAAAHDEGTANAINQAILNGPNGELYKKSGLALVDQSENAADWQRDEQFVSKLIGKVPGFGRLHMASERAYTTVGNVMRAKLFDELYEPGMTDAEAHDIARYINVVSGRAQLTDEIARAMPTIARGIWSPRYAISRVQYLVPMVPGNPLTAASTWRTRKIIAQEYGRYAYKIALVAFLASRAGATVDMDRRSKDFLTIRFGRVEIDPTSGLKQYVRAISQSHLPYIGTGETKDSAGKITQTDSSALAMNFTRGKANPGAGIIYDLGFKRPNKAGQRTDPTGEPYTPGKIVRSLTLPITVDNVIEGMTKFGVNGETARDLATSTLLDVFGVSTNVRDREQEAQQKRLEKRQNARRR